MSERAAVQFTKEMTMTEGMMWNTDICHILHTHLLSNSESR